jgi:hypothetical protein
MLFDFEIVEGLGGRMDEGSKVLQGDYPEVIGKSNE